MLLSDVFVPITEEEIVASGPRKDVENAKSLPECSGTTNSANKVCFAIA